ncbi:Alpha-D-glucose 1-phosphate phosphatase YihX [Candidatus Entotheonellaceae bacterium PAL068K]
MTIAAVIFDYGNVLTRTLDPEPRAAWERQLDLEPGALERTVHNEQSWIAAQCGHLSPEAHWHQVGTVLGLAPAAIAGLRADFYRGDVLNTVLVARIDQLRAAGLRTALLSNFSTELRRHLTTHNLLHRFGHIVISAEIGVMKPTTAAYQAVLDRLAVPAPACVFIDDQPTNIEAAQALGLHGIVFQDNTTCLAALDHLLATPT